MNGILGVSVHQIYGERGGVDGDVPTIVVTVWTLRWQRRVLIESEHHCCRERQIPPMEFMSRRAFIERRVLAAGAFCSETSSG